MTSWALRGHLSECEVFLGLGRHSRAWAGCGCELREDRSEVGNLRVDPGDQSAWAVWLLGMPSAG